MDCAPHNILKIIQIYCDQINHSKQYNRVMKELLFKHELSEIVNLKANISEIGKFRKLIKLIIRYNKRLNGKIANDDNQD